MCGGLLGEAVGGIDKAANSINPLKQPMQWLTDNTIGQVPGVGKPAAQLYDYSNSHPLESLGAMGAAWGGASLLGGAGAEGAGGGAALDTSSTNLFADAAAGGGGDVGATAAGMAGAGADTAGIGTMAGAGDSSSGSFLSSLFGSGAGSTGGGIGMNMATAKNGLGLAQIMSSLYGIDQSRKLSKAATSQAYSAAGAQAVQRSMAAQGYQGSGNMMTALSNYGASAYGNNLQQQQTSLSNTMSGLGLLTAGAGNLMGWGSTTPTKP